MCPAVVLPLLPERGQLLVVMVLMCYCRPRVVEEIDPELTPSLKNC